MGYVKKVLYYIYNTFQQYKKIRKKRKKTEKIKKILNIFWLLKTFILAGLRVLESCQKLKNKK